jgi:hypothetical protein
MVREWNALLSNAGIASALAGTICCVLAVGDGSALYHVSYVPNYFYALTSEIIGYLITENFSKEVLSLTVRQASRMYVCTCANVNLKQQPDSILDHSIPRHPPFRDRVCLLARRHARR